MTKYAANAMLATKISINDRNLRKNRSCINDVRRGIYTRIGFSFCFSRPVRCFRRMLAHHTPSRTACRSCSWRPSGGQRGSNVLLTKRTTVRQTEGPHHRHLGHRVQTKNRRHSRAPALVLIDALLSEGDGSVTTRAADQHTPVRGKGRSLRSPYGAFSADGLAVVTEWRAGIQATCFG